MLKTACLRHLFNLFEKMLKNAILSKNNVIQPKAFDCGRSRSGTVKMSKQLDFSEVLVYNYILGILFDLDVKYLAEQSALEDFAEDFYNHLIEKIQNLFL